MNGSDTLSYYDIATNLVVPFTQLSSPSAPVVANNGTSTITGSTIFTMYYAITANSTVGETAASSSTSQGVDKDRDLWDPSTNSLKITWSAVTNAQSYNVYMAQVASGGSPVLQLVASGVNGLQFIDDGSVAPDITRNAPTSNSTAGPRASRGTNINNRAFLVGDADNPYLVRNGGDYGYELDFSPANGGGYTPVGNGKDVPIAVKLHRDAQGRSVIKVYCQGTNGLGKRFSLTPDSVTYGSTVISFYDVTEDEGESGTDSPDGILHYDNSMWYPSRDGFKTDGTLPQLQNVIKTKRVSNTIQPDMKSITQANMGQCVGVTFEGKLYWALPVGSEMNNEIWVLDLDRKGAWMKPWSLSADWMLLYNDNTGTTHHLVLSDNGLFELTYSALTSDDGTAFATNGHSGEIYFSKDKRMWVKLLQVIFVLTRPQGTLHFSITGKTEDSLLTALGDPTSYDSNASSTVVGWGEPGKLLGWGRRRWSAVGDAPDNLIDGSQEVAIEIDEEIQWASYEWLTSAIGVDYGISDVVFEYIEIGYRDLA